MARFNHIISYSADFGRFRRGVERLRRANQRVARKFGSDFTKAVRVIDTRLDSIRRKRIIDPKTGRASIQTVSRFTDTVKTADGRLKELSTTQTRVNGKQTQMSQTMRDTSKNTVGLAENVKRLASRAALTIPLWLALRQAFTGTLQVIRDGIKDIVEFDASLQKARRNLEASARSPQELTQNFNQLKEEVKDLSRETGVAVQEITNAFQRFATTGFNFEESMRGAEAAVKLAVIEFGDAEETADAFARGLRVLTENMGENVDRGEEIAKAMALTDQLWRSNAFRINEFTNNLNKFAGAANVANLSINETLQLLATLSTGGLGERGGRLLRSFTLRALGNIDEVTRELDLDFDPGSDRTIDFILSMIDALKELGVTGDEVPRDLVGRITDIFNVRSAEPVAALVSLEETLRENLAIQPDLELFNDTFERMNEQVNRLTARFTNLNKEIGRSFVNGLVGGENFADSLQKIIDAQEDILEGAREFGAFWRGLAGIISSTVGAFKELQALLGPTTAEGGFELFQGDDQLSVDIRDISLPAIAEQFEETFETIEERGRVFTANINKALSGDLNVSDITRVLAEVQARLRTGLVPEGIDLNLERVTDNLEDVLLDRIEGILDGSETITKDKVEEINNALSLIDIDENQLQNIRRKIEKSIEEDLNIRNVGGINIIQKEQEKISEAVIKDQLDRLRNEGALQSEIIRTEQALRKKFDVQKTAIDQVKQQLELERAINEEKRLQSRLSSQTIKLFNIAREQGTDVARNIGEVLSGEVDFASFVRRGGDELEVFKKEFESLFEQQQALSFFRGERVPGAEDLRRGGTIPIQEESIRDAGNVFGTVIDAKLKEAGAERDFASARKEQTSSTKKNTEELQKNTSAVREGLLSQRSLTAELSRLNQIVKSGGILGENAIARRKELQVQQSNRQANINRVAQRVAPEPAQRDVNIQSTINVEGTTDPQQTADKIAEEMERESSRLRRNTKELARQALLEE